jgi:hypothetical protein
VERQVPLRTLDSRETAIPDLLIECTRCGIKRLFFIEIKTGNAPFASDNQRYVFPQIMTGGLVYSPSEKIKTFGFNPCYILPPIEGYFGLQRSLDSKPKFWEIPLD